MGSIFGIIHEEMPEYTEVHATRAYEVRRYGPRIAAMTSYGAGGWGESKGDSKPFWTLAKYIGVFGKPENTGEKIPMTAPVLVSAPESEKIPMTAPVLVEASPTSAHKMMFILPASIYSSIEQVPKPTNPDVEIVQLPEQLQAVRTFSGNFRAERARNELAFLLEDLKKDGWTPIEASDGSGVQWQAAGYNSPFVLPCFKRNEILVSVHQRST
eukprot:TRINITY_DN102049_c0_g1_i1.p1 TRINITY_DN102049_c0_g1~~TRINITY_DN102049_c0_g1_i1.p1  ORF type:complete len:213 (+),score=40.23 TRINITY_DN102049_c0_g1_i1:244-882(+)